MNLDAILSRLGGSQGTAKALDSVGLTPEALSRLSGRTADKVLTLAMRLAEAEQRAEALANPADLVTNTSVTTGYPEEIQKLPNNSQVRFEIAPGVYVMARIDSDGVEVSTDWGSIGVRPLVSNVISVRVEER